MRRAGSDSSAAIGYDMQQFNPRIPTSMPQSSSSILNGSNTFHQSMTSPHLMGQFPSSISMSPEQSLQDYALPLGEEFPSLPRSNPQHLKSEYGSDLSNSLSNGLINGFSNGNGMPAMNDLSSQGLSGFGGMIRNSFSSEGTMSSTSNPSLSMPPATASESKQQPSNVKFGLLGLMDVIRMTDKDLNVLALGSDLAGFGLNLNSSECLYSSFTSPFSEQASASEPLFVVPPCYIMHPPTIKPENVAKFQIESLFYMFYMMPRDVMQVIAAQELYRRDWKYHGELRLWLKPRSQAELMQSNPTIPFLFFDVNSWEARLFTSTFARGNILTGFLSEEDIKGVPRPMPGPMPQGVMGTPPQNIS
jgi:hypothetical protein